MTRFARAKGSKSSNERVPESATSWRDMKNELLKKSQEQSEISESNYTRKTFPIDSKQEKAVKWSEFPFDDQQLKIKKNKLISNTLENKKKVDLAENPPVVKQKKKRKRQADNLECTEKSENKNEIQNNNVVELDSSAPAKKKKKKSKKNASKKVHSADIPESTETDQNASTSDFKGKKKIPPNNESTGEIYQKPPNEFQGFHTGLKRNISKPTKTKGGEKKSFSKRNDNEDHKRRKPMNDVNKIYINGNEVELSYYEGFPIKKIDAERLKELKKEMISRGVPKSEVRYALKLERRKAEKALAREKKKVCFNCRRSGHTLSECPALKSGSYAQLMETGICFKCGSTEHTHFECRVTRGDNFKFAQCFICKEQGHIARQCPDNNKGLYPKGGACRICGDVTHLKKDCPQYQVEQEVNKIVVHTIDDHNIESLDIESKTVVKQPQNPQKIIKF